ncbi:aromatic acid/H+ symport family MFS transporter [Arthrobacter sp. B3I4]|uniref:MFS transporter n=1 Tax=Arthrobacter sp. B3I4 TaxID=3042267 RepID=UPI00278A7F6D|nr:aromatic acid/H+ symport family MFS transporter [Arthrobacter sp. B3I4]MDQ0756671.1 AAHS family benzoate transporter-like MFS transporter [Arthrobacter sp. B3I4]
MATIDLRDFIGEARFNRFQAGMLFWACFIITFDMYDLVVYGSVLPVLMKQWSLGPVQAGAIGSYGPVGMMAGAILFGILADRFGRKKILTASIILFSVATALSGFAPGPTEFSVLRALGGLGIGGILPTVIAMLTDYAPRKRANTMVAVVMCFFSVGGILAAFVAMLLLPAFGWQSTYWVAVLPLLFLPFMMKYFLDSPAMLLQKGNVGELRSALSKISGQAALPAAVEFTGLQEREPGSPIGALFTNRRGLGTLMIWVAFFMCLLMVNGLTTWLPKLMVEAGYALNSSLTFTIVLNVGGIVGTLVLGRLADAWGVKRVLVPMFVIAAASLALLGFGNNMTVLLLLVAITGACTMGAQNISYSFVSQYYPSFMRSTAIGLASGVGRMGAIVGPTFGGILLTLKLPVAMNFLFFAIPGVIAALAFLFVPLAAKAGGRSAGHPDQHTSNGAPVPADAASASP